MKIGASTSNLYPELTENALDTILSLGFREIEIFLNTESEAEPDFLRMLRRRVDEVGGRIRSLHPYISGIESYLFFSAYDRRFCDGLKIYEKIFQAAQITGAELVVMHGDKSKGVLSPKESAAHFERIYDLGQRYGVTLAQENVNKYRSSDLDYIRTMRAELGEKAHFVLDIKQCRRSGISPFAMADAMGDRVIHVHVSDQDKERDCLIPGRGNMDFIRLFRQLRDQGFDGSVMLELYRANFEKPEELAQGKEYLEALLKKL